MRTKDRVRQYRQAHPSATVREIQTALGLSSPSVVQYHLTTDASADRGVLVKSWVLDLCEATEDEAAKQIDRPDLSEVEKAYWRGRAHEAKGIRRTIGNLAQDHKI